ncbi:MAG TPA: hypothetical protein VFZ11_14885 [Gemmatimonadaceae bacterium]
MTDIPWPWAALLLLGAVHGINPAMGWLFAVALGLQERSGRAVWRALAPLAAGHALAMLAALAAAAAVGAMLPPTLVRWLVAAALVATAWRTWRGHRHPRGGGMRVGARELTIWSFLMASAHGAGLMILPFVLGGTSAASAGLDHVHAAHGMGVGHAALGAAPPLSALVATALHTGGYLVVTAAVAVVVYERLGLRMLRRTWLNVDVFWAAALVGTAVLMLVV